MDENFPDRLYVGSMNDCLFLIDRPPAPSTDYHPRPGGVTKDIAKLDYRGSSAIANELARRWNAHGDLLSACRAMAAVLQGFTAGELAKRVGEIHPEAFDAAQEQLWAAINKATGESK